MGQYIFETWTINLKKNMYIVINGTHVYFDSIVQDDVNGNDC